MFLTNRRILNLKRMALKNVTSEDSDAYVERAYRHYSKTYATSLQEAKKDIPIEEVLLIYFEDSFEDKTAEEIEEIRSQISSKIKPMFQDSEDPGAPKVLSDDEWIAQQNAILKEQEKKASKKKVKEEGTMSDTVRKANEAIESFAKELNKSFNPNTENIVFSSETKKNK